MELPAGAAGADGRAVMAAAVTFRTRRDAAPAGTASPVFIRCGPGPAGNYGRLGAPLGVME